MPKPVADPRERFKGTNYLLLREGETKNITIHSETFIEIDVGETDLSGQKNVKTDKMTFEARPRIQVMASENGTDKQRVFGVPIGLGNLMVEQLIQAGLDPTANVLKDTQWSIKRTGKWDFVVRLLDYKKKAEAKVGEVRQAAEANVDLIPKAIAELKPRSGKQLDETSTATYLKWKLRLPDPEAKALVEVLKLDEKIAFESGNLVVR